MKKAVTGAVMNAMDYLEQHLANNNQYLASDQPISGENFESGATAGEIPVAELVTTQPATFEHEPKTLYVLGMFLSIALIVAWQLIRLPLGSAGAALTGLALLATGYLGFRLWLAQQSLSMDESGFDLKMGNKTERVEFRSIRTVGFDRLSHDLLVETPHKTYRLARTLQGHRVIRLKLLAASPQVAQNESEVLVVKPRFLPRLAGTLALCVMAICVSVIMWIDPSLGMLNLLGMALPTYVLFDRCIRRSYSLDMNGIKIGGLWKPRFHARGELVSAQIRKGALSSVLRLEFGTESVEMDEYMLGQSLVEVSEYMERNWGTPIQVPGKASGVYPGAATEST